MSTVNLYKVNTKSWAVEESNDDPIVFSSIERAATYLEGLGIPDQEIDYAIIDMAGQNHTRAQFGALEGRFMFSDGEKLNEQFGTS